MSVLERTSTVRTVISPNALINGDLVIYSFPTGEFEVIGKYLVYRVIDDRPFFWNILDTKIEAVNCASLICGHAVYIESVERP